MPPRKPASDSAVTDELPQFFKDAADGAASASRAEVWRLQPNGPAYIGEPPLDATAADLVDFVRGEDKAHGRGGGVYQARLKDANGRILSSARFKVDRDAEFKAPRDDDAGGKSSDPVLAGVGTLVTMLEQQARSYEARVRADMTAREQQARLDADRRRAEAEQERQREREFWSQQRERDRELADQARERDRAMYTFLMQAARPNDGHGGDQAIKTLMAGIALAREFAEDGGGRGGDTFGDKIIGRLADGFTRKFSGDDDDATPITATPATPKREAPVEKRGARGRRPAEPEEPSDAEKMADMLELLVLNTDEHAAATVIESLIKNGKLPRQLVGQLAKGKLDEELEWEKDALDRVHKAAETAYRATAPRPVPASQ